MRLALAAALIALVSCPGPQPPVGPSGPPPGPLPDAAAPPAPDAGPPPLAADGAGCASAAECQSGICEGEGCGAAGGVCAPRRRGCTKDLRPYCGCDGVTFRTSGSCPGRRFAFRGACGERPPPAAAADGAACTTGTDCQSKTCDRGECKATATPAESRLGVAGIIGSHAEVNVQLREHIRNDAMAECRGAGVVASTPVTVAFDVQPDGKTAEIKTTGPDGASKLLACVGRWARGLRFRPAYDTNDAKGKPTRATVQVTLRFDPAVQ